MRPFIFKISRNQIPQTLTVDCDRTFCARLMALSNSASAKGLSVFALAANGSSQWHQAPGFGVTDGTDRPWVFAPVSTRDPWAPLNGLTWWGSATRPRPQPYLTGNTRPKQNEKAGDDIERNSPLNEYRMLILPAFESCPRCNRPAITCHTSLLQTDPVIKRLILS